MLRWLRAKLAAGKPAPEAVAVAAEPPSEIVSPGPASTPAAPPMPFALYRAGRSAEAAAAALQAIEAEPTNLEARRVRALLALDAGQPLDAIRELTAASAHSADDLVLLTLKARALAAAGRRQEANQLLQRARKLHPHSGEPLLGLAMLAIAGRRETEAIEHLQAALAHEPGLADAHYQLANQLRAKGRIEEAFDHYRRAVASAPQHAEALNDLGSMMRERGRLEEASLYLEQALQARPGLAVASYNLAMVRVDQRRWEAARELLQVYVAADPKDADSQYWLGNASMSLGYDGDAREAYQAAVRSNGNYVQARWGCAMAQLPAIAQSQAQQEAAVAAFREEIAKLRSWFRNHPAAEGQRAVGAQQPFYLAYIPRNARAPLSDYGALCQQLMSAWARKVALPKPQPLQAPLRRIAIVSAHLHSHSVWHAIVKGWVEHLDPAQFELHLFHVGTDRDAETEWAVRRVKRMTYGLGEWPNWAKAISDGRFDALIYPEIGMDATTNRLANLRLAPMQLASWGHPVTTGLPTIDAYVSAEAFEPSDADEHYTEKLIRLPRLGSCYQPYKVVPAAVDPRNWGIAAGDAILLCAGAAFKYAPGDDEVLVEIARRCQPCKLVFFHTQPGFLSALLERRLRKAFEAASLDFERHVCFIPWQKPAAFFGLLAKADVFIDSIGFSGFNTAMQAIECGTPIVAWEGAFMRGRFASALLRATGLDEWVSDTAAGFVDRIERLRRDPALRESVRRHIAQARSALFGDRATVAALGDHLLALTTARS
jgi:predicted O-linked N-acetylglucosamine transferase (SPINDLY family)